MKDAPPRQTSLPLRFGWALPLIAGVLLGLDAARGMQQARASWAVRAGPAASSPPRAGRKRIAPVTLSGPGGTFQIPPPEPTIVHVWLQACSDCMPKFDALAKLRADGHQLPLPVVNVAYQRADVDWAKRYGVDERLVIDRDGKALVIPQRIGTLTTLLIDSRGEVVLTDYPNLPGYLQRLQQAAQALPGVPQVEVLESPRSPGPSSLRIAAALLGALTLGLLGCVWGILALLVPSPDSPDSPDSPEAEKEVAADVHLPAWQQELIATNSTCPYCQQSFAAKDPIDRCGRCEATFHRECGEEVGGCTTLGCAAQGSA